MNSVVLTGMQFPIPLHAYAAMAAVVLGGVQLVLPKGTTLHRILGYSWITLMMIVAVSGLFIHTLHVWGIWSPVHLLSVWTLCALYIAIYFAKKKDIKRHALWMKLLYFFALIITGLLTFIPGRAMHELLFSETHVMKSHVAFF